MYVFIFEIFLSKDGLSLLQVLVTTLPFRQMVQQIVWALQQKHECLDSEQITPVGYELEE